METGDLIAGFRDKLTQHATIPAREPTPPRPCRSEEKVAQVETVIQDLLGFKEELETLRDKATSLVDCRPLGGNICSIIVRDVSVIACCVE